MPAKFYTCKAAGGKIRTKRLNKKEYMRICIPKGGGPSVGGEVHRYASVLKEK